METKVCTKCKQELPATREYFHAMKGGGFGLRPSCKECRKAPTKAYRQDHQKEIKAYKKTYCQVHKEKLKKESNIYYQAHKKEIRTRVRNYYQSHREDIKTYYITYNQIHYEEHKAYCKTYYQNHKEQQIAQDKARRLANPEKYRARGRIYAKTFREAHREEINAKKRKYYQDHREQCLLVMHRRRAIKQKATVSGFNEKAWLESQAQPYHCYLCGKIIRKNQKLHIDHRIPVSRGGAHATWNLGLTHAKCNLEKSSKTPFEYAPDRFSPTLF